MNQMAAPNRTANQHWVPQFYLRQFATHASQHADEPQMWFLDISRPAKEQKLTSVRNMCGWRYLYSPKDTNGERDLAVEELLGRAETVAASIWPHLIGGTADLSDHALREALSYFFAFMHLRGAWLYKLIDRTMELRDKLFGPLTAESLAAREPGMPDPTDSGRFFVDQILQGAERFATIFSAKHWAVMCADKDLLLTSDRPFLLQSDEHRRDRYVFPLSPRRALFMTDVAGPEKSLYMPMRETTATNINLTLGVHCMRFIFAGHSIPEVVGDENFAQTIASLREKRETEHKRKTAENLRKYQQQSQDSEPT